MASPKKLAANRANACAGTGPRTAVGRARSARNARRHGLNIPVMSDRWLSAEAEALAHEIAWPDAEPEILHLARRIAEAQIDLVRVRQRRQDLLSDYLSIDRYVPQKLLSKGLKFILDRESKPEHESVPLPSDLLPILSPPSPAKNFLLILSDLAQELAAIDRYERRALSRRKFAIRAFDLARRNSAS
jgi:hypothetical protein